MKKQAKSLLIHNDTKRNETTAIVVDEKDILPKTKEFLKTISGDRSPLGIVLKTEKGKGFTVAYEKENFVIVAQNGSKKVAKLYGNWDEAVISAQKLLSKIQKGNRIILAQYILD